MHPMERRDLIKAGLAGTAAAWTAPVIHVGAAAPAMAASPGVLQFTGTACKVPGKGQEIDKGYVLGFSVSNLGNGFPLLIQTVNFRIINATDTITPFAVQLSSDSGCAVIPLPLPDPRSGVNTLEFGEGVTNIALYLAQNGNSRNTTLELQYAAFNALTKEVVVPADQGFVTASLSGDPTTGGCEPHPGWYLGCDIPEEVTAAVAPVE